jgi:hypothetical protein
MTDIERSNARLDFDEGPIDDDESTRHVGAADLKGPHRLSVPGASAPHRSSDR